MLTPGKEEKFFKPNLDMQTLADLGYPKDIRSNLSVDKVKDIIDKNIRYENFKAEEVNISESNNVDINPALKEKYRLAYQKLEGIRESLVLRQESLGDNEGIYNFKEVLRLSANGSIDEIDSFLREKQDLLQEEEIEFLNVAKEFNLNKNQV